MRLIALVNIEVCSGTCVQVHDQAGISYVFRYMTKREFPSSVLPHFITGSMYMMPGRTAGKLMAEAARHAHVHLEDVYFTGILREALRIPIIDLYNIDRQPVSVVLI